PTASAYRLCSLHSAVLLLALHSFPTRRSSDLVPVGAGQGTGSLLLRRVQFARRSRRGLLAGWPAARRRDHRSAGPGDVGPALRGDRKSTRLNSSHRTISYAVFCLKKKKKNMKF